MAKSSNRRNNVNNSNLPPMQAIPDDISGSAERLAARTQGRIAIDLKPNSYREHQVLRAAHSIVRIGTTGGAKPTFSHKQHQDYLAIADLFGRTATIPTHRFDMSSSTVKPVTVQTQPVNKDGYIVYVPARSIHHTFDTGITNAKALTHVGLDWSEQKVVSFITADRDEAHNERAFMAATETAQNRLSVTGVRLENGKVHTSRSAYEPYQESIANGLGNMLGSVAIGSNYRRYSAYIHGIYRHRPMHAGNLPGTFFNKDIQLVAPHVLFCQQFYEEVSDGEIPSELPELVPVIPAPTGYR